MHRRDGIIDSTSRDRLKRINLFLDEFNNLHDVSLFVHNMLAEGKSIFNGHAAACWLTDETGSLTQYQFDPDDLWPELVEAMKLFDTADKNQFATIFNYSDLSKVSAKIFSNSGGETPEIAILYHLPKLQNYTGYLLFLSCLENPDKKVMEEGALLANLTGLVLQSSLLSETVLTQSSEMGLFYETTAALSIEFETPQLLETTLNRALNLLDGDFGYIFTAAENQNDPILHLAVSHQPDQPEIFIHSATLAAKESLKNNNPLVITNPHELLAIPAPDGKDSPDQSLPTLAMAAPILWSDQLLGTLVILSSSPVNNQSRHDMGQLRLVSFQIANALGVTKLIEAEREQRRFIEALQTASVAIGRQIHLDEVLDKILEQALHAFNCDAANIMVIDGGKARIERARGYDIFGLHTEVIENFSLRINEHNNLLLMSEGEALHVADTNSCEDWIPHKGFNWCQSWAGGPIFYGGTLLGFLNLDSAEPHSFSDEILGQLQAFATHAGIALHKARLLKRLTDEHIRLQKIYNVGRDISSSLEPDKILHELLKACLEVLSGVYGAIFSINQETGTVSLMRKENPHKLQNLHELYLVELLAKRIHKNQEPDCDYIAYTDSSYWLLGLPLRTAQSTLGIVMIWIPSASDFEQAWMDALANLGQHAALALTKAEKHLELQRRLNELTILQHVSGVIASHFDLDAILTELTEQLHNKLGFDATQVFVREKNQLLLRKFSGPPPPLSALNLSVGIIGRVARTGIPEFVPNVKLDSQYLSVFSETTSEIAVPISYENKVIGVLNVESSDSALLDEGSMELLLLLADQISIAFQNAELNEQIRDTVENLESRVQARTAVLEAVAVQAQDAERAKAQFVADVSHELRTPLTNIGLYLDLLEHGPDSRYHEYFQTMRRETERLGGLIEQLLTISRLDSDQFELQFTEVNVNNLLLSLANDRKMMARKKGLVLDLEIDDNLPVVQADPQYLNQVMTNLLTNAMNYTPEGGRILIRSEMCADKETPGVCFAIEDTGPGIPLSEQSDIFSRFYRGSAGKNSGVSGTGLGLSISREIINQHRGTINVNSVKDRGTTFTVWIPIFDAHNILQT